MKREGDRCTIFPQHYFVGIEARILGGTQAMTIVGTEGRTKPATPWVNSGGGKKSARNERVSSSEDRDDAEGNNFFAVPEAARLTWDNAGDSRGAGLREAVVLGATDWERRRPRPSTGAHFGPSNLECKSERFIKGTGE